MKPTAIIWDYDGTLMDSTHKNFMVTLEILKEIKPEFEEQGWPVALTSLKQYRKATHYTLNWRDFYINHFGVTDEEATQAGKMWSEYQLQNQTPSHLFDGIPEVIQNLKSFPQGICSLNCAENIKNMLKQNYLDHYFKSIIGYTDISPEKQKPHPEPFLYCLERMNINGDGLIVYIGDHEEDMKFARNAEQTLNENGQDSRIVAIAACYSGSNPDHWETKPDYNAQSVKEIEELILLAC